jgi:hypothetical protein
MELPVLTTAPTCCITWQDLGPLLRDVTVVGSPHRNHGGSSDSTSATILQPHGAFCFDDDY